MIAPYDCTRSMYRPPSTSTTYAPSARATKYGVPPTDWNDRTGELTPPGMTRRARSKSSLLVTRSPDSSPLRGDASHCDLGSLALGARSRSKRLGERAGEVREDHVGPRTL